MEKEITWYSDDQDSDKAKIGDKMGVLDRFLNAMKLNDDYDEDDYLDDEIDDEFEDDRPVKKHFFKKNDEFEDDFQDDFKIKEPRKTKTEKMPESSSSDRAKQVKFQSTASSSSKVAPIRPRKISGGMTVCVIKPKSMEDAREITETLLNNCTVVLNLEGLDLDIAQRIIDFASGSCYAINGTLQKISGYIFIITPSSVDVSGDIQEILGGAFDVPSVRSSRF